MFCGFLSEEHKAHFEARRAEAQKPFGHPERALCGARTRGGGTCRCVPVKGFNRCRKHVGYKGSLIIRERELEELARGELALADWLRLERRRAVNRLRHAWKKQPWTPGATIDLGEAGEAAFQSELARLGQDMSTLAPAVLDWLRWRFRRAKLDRDQPRLWAETIEQLPERIERAGPKPAADMLAALPWTEPAWTAPAKVSPWSKRRRPDTARPSRAARVSVSRGRGAPLPTISREELAVLLRTHRDALAPIMGRYATEEQQLAAAAAFKALADADGAPGAVEAYHRALGTIERSARG